MCNFAVIALHDEQSEPLTRRLCISMVETAAGGKLTRQQAAKTWDQTIYPLGKKMGLLTGYVKAQLGTSKRTAAGNIALQQKWHETVDALLSQVTNNARKVLRDEDLVQKLLPSLVVNLDEESLCAMGKNERVVGSKQRKKHDNQNGTSRFVAAVAVAS